MVAPPIFWWLAPQTALPLVVVVGLKPPWNQPQVTPLASSRLPTFVPLMAMVVPPAQSSNVGVGSAITVPLEPLPGILAGVAPCDWPAIRLSAPGVEGPNVVPYELSLMAKCCA